MKKTELELTDQGIMVYALHKMPISGKDQRIKIEEIKWKEEGIEVNIKVNSIKPEIINGELKKVTLGVNDVSKSDKKPGEFWSKIEEELGIIKEGNDIVLNGNKSAKKNLIDFVDYLLENGYIESSDIPIRAGYKRYLLNFEPIDIEGEPMASDEELRDGFYLETKFSRMQIKDKIKQLGEKFEKER